MNQDADDPQPGEPRSDEASVIKSLNLSASAPGGCFRPSPPALANITAPAKAVLTTAVVIADDRTGDRSGEAGRSRRPRRQDDARSDLTAALGLYSHLRSPKAARSTPAGAYQPPAR